MPIKSANSIECDCGGRYTPKNKSKHMKTKKHQKYEETQPDVANNICRHCGKEAEFDKDTTECTECGMYQDIEVQNDD